MNPSLDPNDYVLDDGPSLDPADYVEGGEIDREANRKRLTDQMWQVRQEALAQPLPGKTQPGGVLDQVGIGLTQGFAQLGQQSNRVLAEAARWDIGPITAIPGVREWAVNQFGGAAKVAGRAAGELEQLGQATQGPDFARVLSSGVVSTVPSMVVAPAGLPAAALVAGMQSFGGTMEEAEQAYIGQGMDQDTARRKAYAPALASGVITALVTKGFGKTGIENWTEVFQGQGWKPIAKSLAKESGFEAGEEWLDQIGQSVVAKLSYNPDMTVQQAFEEAAQAGLAGGIAAGGLHAVNLAGQRGAAMGPTAAPPPPSATPPPPSNLDPNQARPPIAPAPSMMPPGSHLVWNVNGQVVSAGPFGPDVDLAKQREQITRTLPSSAEFVGIMENPQPATNPPEPAIIPPSPAIIAPEPAITPQSPVAAPPAPTAEPAAEPAAEPTAEPTAATTPAPSQDPADYTEVTPPAPEVTAAEPTTEDSSADRTPSQDPADYTAVDAAETPAAATPVVEAVEPTEPQTTTRLVPDSQRVVAVEFPIDQIVVDPVLVPQFKDDADAASGEVRGEELSAAKYERPSNPIVVWQLNDGRNVVVTGRHRLALAKRLGEKTIPATLVREADGFTRDQALTLDAEFNIRDGQGSVRDYAHYFETTGTLDQAEARARGLLDRAKGKAGWHLARSASDDLRALYRAGKITEGKAVAIAQTAPGNEAVQRIGVRYADRTEDFIVNMMRAALAESGGRAQTLDLFGSDDSAIRQMEAQAKVASAAQRGLREQIAAVSGAAKRPEVAKRMGVDVANPEAVRAKIVELRAELERWDNWPMHPDLVAATKNDGQVKEQAKPPESFRLQVVTEEQLKAEQAATEARAKADAQREALESQASAPLTGNSADVGQGKLFAADADLFSGPSAESSTTPPKSDLASPEEGATLKEDVAQIGQFLERNQIPRGQRAVAARVVAAGAQLDLPLAQPRSASVSTASPSGELQRSAESAASPADAALTSLVLEGLADRQTGVPIAKAFAANSVVSSIRHVVSGKLPAFNIDGQVINTPEEFAALLAPLRSPFFESLKVAVLDNQGMVVHSQVLAVGNVDTTITDASQVLRVVIEAQRKTPSASRVMLAHNHPSGNPQPSEADLRVTRDIKKALARVNISLVDHVVTNGKRAYSITRDTWVNVPEYAPAPWEVVARENLPEVSEAERFGVVVSNLRQGNPGVAHVIYLSTRNTIVAVERASAGVDTQSLWQLIQRGAAREGARGLLVDLGAAAQMSQMLAFAEAVRQGALSSAKVDLLDIAYGPIMSSRAQGVALGGPATTNPYLDAAIADSVNAEPGVLAAATRARSVLSPQPGMKIRTGSPEGGFVDLRVLQDMVTVGAKLVSKGFSTFASWAKAMTRVLGNSVKPWLARVWGRVTHLTRAAMAGLSPEGVANVNRIEAQGDKSDNVQIRPVYPAGKRDSAWRKAGRPSRRLAYFGSASLLRAKQELDLEESYQSAAVKAASDRLLDQLERSAYDGRPGEWKLPRWMRVGAWARRLRVFKRLALPIAAHLNATGRDPSGNFVFSDFEMRSGLMTVREFVRGKHSVGSVITVDNPLTGASEEMTIGNLVTLPNGRSGYQLTRAMTGAQQSELYRHYADEFPELMWLVDMYVDPDLAGVRQTVNGIQVPLFNRFSQAAMLVDTDPRFQALEAYTPDVLVARSLMGAVRGALGLRRGTRSPGRRYKTGASRESGEVRDLLTGHNVRTFQMLQERARRQFFQAILRTAAPIPGGVVPEGFVKLDLGMEELWQAVKRLRFWRSPRDPVTGAALFPETESRMGDDGSPEYKAFFGEAASLRGRQLMISQALLDTLLRKYAAYQEHGMLYRMGAWLVRNSTQLFLAHPKTYVANVLTNDLFALEAAYRHAISGIAKLSAKDLRYASGILSGMVLNRFKGLRELIHVANNTRFMRTVREVLPDQIFADSTQLSDVKVRYDDNWFDLLRRGELGGATLQIIQYGTIDVRAKQRLAYAWLRATAITNARRAGLRGRAHRAAVDGYMANPPMEDRARAVASANFELLNYSDSPDWLNRFSRSDYGRLVLPFPRFGYHYLAKQKSRLEAVKLLVGKVPKGQRADAFADLVTVATFGLGGAGLVFSAAIRALLDMPDEEDARQHVGTSTVRFVDEDGRVKTKAIDRELVTSNRVNLSYWARALGLDTESEDDFWLRTRNYPVVAMAGAAALALDDARRFGPQYGVATYASTVGDLAGDFFSVGMAIKIPDKALAALRSTASGRPEKPMLDPYATNVPFLAYLTEQAVDSLLPGSRQVDEVIWWLDPIQRRKTASSTLDFYPGVWDGLRAGHVTGLIDRLLSEGESTLPPAGEIDRRLGMVINPREIPTMTRVLSLGGFNVKPVDRAAYEAAVAP